MPSKPLPETVLRTYFHAKDENRPHLMRDAFCESAALRMHLLTENIAFPAESQGIEAITDSLVRTFGQKYENVYSFYMDRPAPDAASFSCHWLVGMSDKATGDVRVGCGRYDWEFDEEGGTGLAKRLAITIDSMQILPPGQLQPVLDWLGSLTYPWTRADAVAARAPAIDALAPVMRYLSGQGETRA
jgi:hypothetical protein